jgi:hypothetical protein
VLSEIDVTAALAGVERLLADVEAGRLQCSPTQRERLRGAALALEQLLGSRPSTNIPFGVSSGA